MPCDGLVEEQRRRELLAELEVELATGKRRVIRNLKGEVQITSWVGSSAQKAGLCEGCVLRQLQQTGSWVTKQKLAQAGITSNKSFVVSSHNGHSH